VIKPYFIGIAGGSASGKTSVLEDLKASKWIKHISLVSQDNYYKSREEQLVDENGIINFDLPTAIDRSHFLKDLTSLRNGESILKTEYTFNNDAAEATEISVDPAEIIIIEGLFVFFFEEIKAMMDYKVFIDADSDVRLTRRIDRDLNERGYPESDVRYRWKHHVQPADEKYLQPYKNHCQLIIDSSISYKEGYKDLEQHIQHILKHEKSISLS